MNAQIRPGGVRRMRRTRIKNGPQQNLAAWLLFVVVMLAVIYAFYFLSHEALEEAIKIEQPFTWSANP
jgi:hypothetical protein